MLKHLSYSVTFPSTGRTLAATVRFQPGFGVITGPNESGKSQVLEVIRFCLFGSAVLRGKAEDYKSLKAELQFAVRGDNYSVVRTGTSAKLLRGKEEIAVGVRPVNEKLLKVLGFGLDVFDVVCVANQGEIERLGAMKPTERKRMVDTVVGLSLIDELARWAGEEALSLFREAEPIERTLVAPVAPEQPGGYRPSCKLEAEIADLQRKQERLSALEGCACEGRAGGAEAADGDDVGRAETAGRCPDRNPGAAETARGGACFIAGAFAFRRRRTRRARGGDRCSRTLTGTGGVAEAAPGAAVLGHGARPGGGGLAASRAVG